MNKIKLPSMVEYVSILGESSTFDKDITDWINEELGKLEKIRSFTKRISQQPNIGMFVPAVCEDGEWRVLRTPIEHNPMYWSKEYTTALDNVIFEGFELNQKDTSKLENIICITLGKIQLTFFLKNKALFLDNLENNYTTKINTIEQLIPYNLTLTPKFAKELGLI
jgi:hypothetical protein